MFTDEKVSESVSDSFISSTMQEKFKGFTYVPEEESSFINKDVQIHIGENGDLDDEDV